MLPEWLGIAFLIALVAILVGLDRRVLSGEATGLTFVHPMVVLIAGGSIGFLGVYFLGGIIPINSIVVPLSFLGLGMAIAHVLGTVRLRT